MPARMFLSCWGVAVLPGMSYCGPGASPGSLSRGLSARGIQGGMGILNTHDS